MIKKTLSGPVLVLVMLCLFTGCMFSLPTGHMTKIKGDITCEFRCGKNATNTRDPIKTDVVFDKDRFVELFNEDAKYDPAFYKKHTDRLDLKINDQEEPEKYQRIAGSEVNLAVRYDGNYNQVSLYCFDSKLYFFVMNMGGASMPEEKGWYYQEVPSKMASYWMPIYEKVMADYEASRPTRYGSFTTEKTFSYDNKYYAESVAGSDEKITVNIYDESGSKVYSFAPCWKNDFQGICWENDSYNIWVQFHHVNVTCYRQTGSSWMKDESLRKPDYMIGITDL
jgi:hypothetical protein